MTLLKDCSEKWGEGLANPSFTHFSGSLHSSHASGTNLHVNCQAGLNTPMTTPRMKKLRADSLNVNAW